MALNLIYVNETKGLNDRVTNERKANWNTVKNNSNIKWVVKKFTVEWRVKNNEKMECWKILKTKKIVKFIES